MIFACNGNGFIAIGSFQLTANVRLEVVTLSIATGQSEAWAFTANGPGFHTADALLMAEERLIKQISADTKMSLSQISQGN